MRRYGRRHTPTTWNQKNLDYEIETARTAWDRRAYRSWNQKNLDYEIETFKVSKCWLCVFQTWNQKNLDYEIETLLKK